MLLLLLLLLACRDPDPVPAGVEPDTVADATDDVEDADATWGTDRTSTAAPCTVDLSVPAGPLVPVPGELYYEQIYVGGLTLGESAIVIGPDGTRLLIDVGNDAHDDDIVEALEAVAASLDTQGLGPVDPTQVDHILLTHLHADHVDGFEDLMGTVTVRDRVIHRGLVDLVLANDGAVDTLCTYFTAHPGQELALCDAMAPACAGGAATTCGRATVPLGPSAALDVVAANGFIAGVSMEASTGPFLTDDSNGENARSLVGILSHGPFRLLFAGDLTGGGSDTDAVEAFFAPHLATELGPLGVDVLHAGHHGRDTSSSDPWLDTLLPGDGRTRHVVMGISPAHVGSPHGIVLDRLFTGDRLADGLAWATTVAPRGTTAPQLVAPGSGNVRVRTLDGGKGYAVQWVDVDGTVARTAVSESVRACPLDGPDPVPPTPTR